MTRPRRVVRERISEDRMTVEELSLLSWLIMQDMIALGLADRDDMSQALFMQELRPNHPEWSPAELRRWTDGGRWRHGIKFGRPFPYCEPCGRHFDHGTVRGRHVCSICEGPSLAG